MADSPVRGHRHLNTETQKRKDRPASLRLCAVVFEQKAAYFKPAFL
jgi:hypothetical protein